MTERPAGVILAGGLATRLGGRDKALASWQGQPLAAWVARRLAPQVGALWLNVRQATPAHAALGLPLLTDPPETAGAARGPLWGVLAALQALPTTPLLVCPCDTPRVPLDLGARLAAAAKQASVPLAMAVTPRGSQPLHLWLRPELAPALAGWLAAGGATVRDWIATQPHTVARFDDDGAFDNFNTCADFDAC